MSLLVITILVIIPIVKNKVNPEFSCPSNSLHLQVYLRMLSGQKHTDCILCCRLSSPCMENIQAIVIVDSYTYLGVILHRRLDWPLHIKELIRKSNSNI